MAEDGTSRLGDLKKKLALRASAEAMSDNGQAMKQIQAHLSLPL